MPRHPSLISLSHDHHHGLALALRCRKQALGRIKPVGLEGLRERAAEFREFFRSSLDHHFKAEEDALFPFMRSSIPQSGQLIPELLLEHEQIRSSVHRLEGDNELAKLLFDVGDLLERHIRREERELFPLFEQQVSPTEAEKVQRDIEKILKRE